MSNLIDNLLDASLEDLASLPDYKNPDEGSYKVTVEAISLDKEKQSVQAKFKILEVLEGADESNVGLPFSTFYKLDNEYGQNNLRKLLTPLAESLGVSKISEVMEQAGGMQIALTVKHTRDKKDSEKIYVNIRDVVVA